MNKDKTYKLNHKEDGCTCNIKVEFGTDGHLHFCGKDAWTEQIHLYPKQVKELIEIITKRAKKEAKKNE